ncbi:MAG: hypothetical protein RMM29_06485 [Planctomycetota bacterium]|nr:hypothetical protein [Planctomycetota bacterium]MCX8040517.1 hypothetical protein [Planctomycetota bacterium]MDW8373278.1 hypothetical protein [Planctomycetota bacterium]
MRRCSLAVLAAYALLAACAAPGPRVPPWTRAQALAATEPLEVTIVRVWDTVRDAVREGREPGISHIIEVEVRSGEQAGQRLALPYDEWNVGAPPPRAGRTLVIAPADWVRRAKDTRGRPFSGW